MNLVVLEGRLGADIELKTLETGTKVANLSVATNDGTKDKPKTNWHNCVAFGKTAEIMEKYLKKGSEVLIQGSINYNKKEDKIYTSIFVDRFEFVGGKSDVDSSKSSDDSDDMPVWAKVIKDKFDCYEE